MNTRPLSVILIVVATISAVVVLGMAAFVACALRGMAISPETAGVIKDLTNVALGGLVGLLASTRTGDNSTPVPTTITNTAADPVPTAETGIPANPVPPATQPPSAANPEVR